MTKFISVTLYCLIISSLFYSCKENMEAESSQSVIAQSIIDKCIEAHGGSGYDSLYVGFTFRSKDYTILLDHGRFEYTRSFADSTGVYFDVLNNEGFTRTKDNELLELSDKDIRRFKSALNSIPYFTILPKGLNDPAVNKELLTSVTIKSVPYHAIKVTFEEEGGGEDFDDEYRYWINKETNTIDFLAYNFHVNNGGVRFREAFDPIDFNGVRFQNYVNYKPEDKNTPLDDLPGMFERGELSRLSEIVNENLRDPEKNN